MNVKLSAAQKIKIANSKDIYGVMQQILLRENRIGRAQEHYWIIGLNNNNKILFVELLALGQTNRVSTNPPEAFRMAIYKLATQVVFVHNHPSGNTAPSKEDIAHTDYLYKAGNFLAIDVLDHLVISETTYHSFAVLGLMDDIKNSGAWELLDRTKIELKEMQAQVEKEKAVKAAYIEMARKLKGEGLSEELIKRTTGLTLKEIRRM